MPQAPFHVAYASSVLNVHDWRFLAKLVERGHRTTLITYFPGPLPPAIAGIDGLEVVHRRPWLPVRLSSRAFLWRGRAFRRMLAALKPDVLHSGYVWKDGLAGALSGFRPHLVMPWGSDILLEPNQSRVVRAMVQFVLRRADMITCDCELVARRIEQLSGYPRDRIEIFPWGVDRRHFRPDISPVAERRELGWSEKLVVLMNRTLRPLYNVRGFLEALPEVVRACPDVRVLLLGTGPEEGVLRALAQRSGLGDLVRFIGAVPPEAMGRWLRAADLYVSNSYSDGSSLSLLEAMACGLPVVVSDAPANLEWVVDGANGLVVPRGDPRALTHAIVTLLRDEARRAEMGRRNAAVAAERADWDKNFLRLEAMYARMIGRAA